MTDLSTPNDLPISEKSSKQTPVVDRALELTRDLFRREGADYTENDAVISLPKTIPFRVSLTAGIGVVGSVSGIKVIGRSKDERSMLNISNNKGLVLLAIVDRQLECLYIDDSATGIRKHPIIHYELLETEFIPCMERYLILDQLGRI